MKSRLDKKNYTITKQPGSMIEIAGDVPKDLLEQYRDAAFAVFAERVEIDGFRKGNAPKEAVLQKIGPMALLEEMAQRALTDIYFDIIQNDKIDAIGRPNIVITKIAEGSDLGFKITTAVIPEIKLPDYKKIAKAKNKESKAVEITEAEIDTAILELRKMRAHQEMHENGVEHHDHNHHNIEEKDLPEFTDEMVKSFGPFENIADFRIKLAENMKKEKEMRDRDARRMEIVEGLVIASGIEVPDMLVEYEIDKIMGQMEYDVSMAGLKMDEYLQSINKTKDDMRKDFRDEAKKRSAMQLVINKIVTEEKLEPTEQEIDAEVAKIMEFYKNTQGVNTDQARAYVTTVLTNQKFFEFLDAQK